MKTKKQPRTKALFLHRFENGVVGRCQVPAGWKCPVYLEPTFSHPIDYVRSSDLMRWVQTIGKNLATQAGIQVLVRYELDGDDNWSICRPAA
jgi:hypothetical protein